MKCSIKAAPMMANSKQGFGTVMYWGYVWEKYLWHKICYRYQNKGVLVQSAKGSMKQYMICTFVWTNTEGWGTWEENDQWMINFGKGDK